MKFSLITRQKKFAPFFWTQFLGAFNDNFFKNALVVLVAFRGVQIAGIGAKELVAIAGALFILPYFLFSPIAGQISDKFEKSKVIRMTKLAEILIMLVAAAGFLLESYTLLMGVLFLMGTQSAFFGPVKYSLIPELVPEDQLMEGNAFIELGTFVAILLGTITGGLVTASPMADQLIGVGLIGIAVFGYLTSRKVQASAVAAGDLQLKWNPFPQYVELLKISREQRAVWNSILAISWFWFFGAGILSILPLYVKDYLAADEQVVTVFLAMFTLGIGIGSMLSERLSFKRVEIGLVPIGSLGMTIFLLDLYFTSPAWGVGAGALTLQQFMTYPEAWRMLFDFLMMSIFGGIFIVPLYTLLQERSPSSKRSRVIAANNIINAVFMVLSSLLVLVFYSFNLDTAEIFAVFALLNVVVAIYIYSVVPEFALRFLSWILSHVMYKVRVKGRDNIPREGACILACNHVSYVDWLILFAICNRPARFVMYYKFFQIPILRVLFKQAKIIAIAGARENPEILDKAFADITRELVNGEPVIIFPEGRITSDGKLSPFRPGIQKMVNSTPCPVVPVVIHGLWGSIFSRSKKKQSPHRRLVSIEIFPPIPPDDFDVLKLEKLFAEQLGEESPSEKSEPAPEISTGSNSST